MAPIRWLLHVQGLRRLSQITCGLFPALRALSMSRKVTVDGFICPGHVSVITGTRPYETFVERYKKPCVITGFDDDDIVQGITRLVKQIQSGDHKVEIEYKRAVKPDGNVAARKMVDRVFKAVDSEWRGLGIIKKSGLKIRTEYTQFDAEQEFDFPFVRPARHAGCRCGDVLQGIINPVQCKLFRNKCTPQRPVGPCMVSTEGTCAAYYKYGEM